VALNHDRYTYRVMWSEEDHEYVGLCTEFPSLSWLAPSPEAAFKGIRKVVADVVHDLEVTGEAAPEPIATKSWLFRTVIFPSKYKDFWPVCHEIYYFSMSCKSTF